MPLNYDFGKTEFFKTEGTLANSEPAADGLYYNRPEVEYVIWAAVFVGIPTITEKNVETFIARCELWDKVHDPFVRRFSFVTEEWVSAFDADFIRRCVGFHANVTPKTKTQFIANLTRGMNL